MSKKRGLGKGIGALIPDFDEELMKKTDGILQVNIDEIKTNPFQPRKIFSDEKIQELAASIKEKGILQPLLAKKDASGYELIAGERRLRAAYKAGLSIVPVMVKKVDDQSRQEMALIENIQRENLNVIEEAEAYQDLIERFHYTQEDVSKRVGKSRTAVTNTLRLLKLSRKIKQDLFENRISMGHARAYLGLDSVSKQEEVHRMVIKNELSVRNTEKLIKKLNKETPKKQKKIFFDFIKYDYVLEELKKRFSTKINIIQKGQKGKIVFEFYSNDDFERIYELLRG